MSHLKKLTGFDIAWKPPSGRHRGVLTINNDSRFVSRMELIRVGFIFIKKGLFK